MLLASTALSQALCEHLLAGMADWLALVVVAFCSLILKGLTTSRSRSVPCCEVYRVPWQRLA
jgi:hypothetical protein